MNSKNLISVLELLLSSKVNFSLLREVNIENLEDMADFDIYMPLDDYYKYLAYLDIKQIKYIFVNPYVLNKKQLMINEILLDIDIEYISFDLYKCIRFKPEVKKINSTLNFLNLPVPIFCREYLYVIWLMHFIFDKKDFKAGSTSSLFYIKYRNNMASDRKYLQNTVDQLNLSYGARLNLCNVLMEFRVSMMSDFEKSSHIITNCHSALCKDMFYIPKLLITRLFFAIYRRVN